MLTIKKIMATIVLTIMLLPSISLAAPVDYFVGANSNGDISVGFGSPNGIRAMTQGGSASWMANPFGLPEGSILGIIQNLLFWLLMLFGIFGVLGFVISGIFYLVAAGDEGMMEKGKDGMKWSIIGIIVGLSGFIVIQAVAALLSGQSNRF